MLFGMFREVSEKQPDYSPVSIEEIKIDESKLKKPASLVNKIKIGDGPNGCQIYHTLKWQDTSKGNSRIPEDCFIAVKSEIEGRGKTWEEATQDLNEKLSRVQE